MSLPNVPCLSRSRAFDSASRRNVILKLDEAICTYGMNSSKSSVEIEDDIFRKSESFNEYTRFVELFISTIRDMHENNVETEVANSTVNLNTQIAPQATPQENTSTVPLDFSHLTDGFFSYITDRDAPGTSQQQSSNSSLVAEPQSSIPDKEVGQPSTAQQGPSSSRVEGLQVQPSPEEATQALPIIREENSSTNSQPQLNPIAQPSSSLSPQQGKTSFRNLHNYVIHPPNLDAGMQQSNALPSIVPNDRIMRSISAVKNAPPDTIKILIMLESGEQRLLSLTLPHGASTLGEVMEHVVPRSSIQPDTPVEVIENNIHGINYVVKVGKSRTTREDQAEESGETSNSNLEVEEADRQRQAASFSPVSSASEHDDESIDDSDLMHLNGLHFQQQRAQHSRLQSDSGPSRIHLPRTFQNETAITSTNGRSFGHPLPIQCAPGIDVEFGTNLLLTYRMFLHAHECDQQPCAIMRKISPLVITNYCNRAKVILDHSGHCNDALRCGFLDCIRFQKFQTHFKSCTNVYCQPCKLLKIEFDLSRQMRVCMRSNCSLCWTLIQLSDNYRGLMTNIGEYRPLGEPNAATRLDSLHAYLAASSIIPSVDTSASTVRNSDSPQLQTRNTQETPSIAREDNSASSISEATEINAQPSSRLNDDFSSPSVSGGSPQAHPQSVNEDPPDVTNNSLPGPSQPSVMSVPSNKILENDRNPQSDFVSIRPQAQPQGVHEESEENNSSPGPSQPSAISVPSNGRLNNDSTSRSDFVRSSQAQPQSVHEEPDMTSVSANNSLPGPPQPSAMSMPSNGRQDNDNTSQSDFESSRTQALPQSFYEEPDLNCVSGNYSLPGPSQPLSLSVPFNGRLNNNSISQSDSQAQPQGPISTCLSQNDSSPGTSRSTTISTPSNRRLNNYISPNDFLRGLLPAQQESVHEQPDFTCVNQNNTSAINASSNGRLNNIDNSRRDFRSGRVQDQRQSVLGEPNLSCVNAAFGPSQSTAGAGSIYRERRNDVITGSGITDYYGNPLPAEPRGLLNVPDSFRQNDLSPDPPQAPGISSHLDGRLRIRIALAGPSACGFAILASEDNAFPRHDVSYPSDWIEHHLPILSHAYLCHHMSRYCDRPGCAERRHILAHFFSCALGRNCPRGDCQRVRDTIWHWKHCQNSNVCRICWPLMSLVVERSEQIPGGGTNMTEFQREVASTSSANDASTRRLDMMEQPLNAGRLDNSEVNNNTRFNADNINSAIPSTSGTSQARGAGPSPVKRIKLENATETQDEEVGDERDLCKICMDAQMNTVFLECGHIVACITCARKSRTCPICRKPISRWLKTYKA